MARLPTTTATTSNAALIHSPSSDSLEVVIDAAEEDFEMTTSRFMTGRRSAAVGGAVAKKKLNGIWRQLASLSSSSDLVQELKAVHDYLAPMDQDSVDRSELLDLAAQLASPSLIKHKERAVRILTACALANILRLFAPEAPYSSDQLEGMFLLFLHQLKGVAEQDDPYYNYHYFLLESLSTVKSVVLVFDLPQGELIQRELIQMALDLMHPSLIKGVRLYLLELVQTLIEEADQLPLELVTETLLPALDSSNSAQSAMISDLLKLCAEKLQAPLGIHFNDQLSRLARAEESETALAKIGKEAHDFAIKIASISPVAAASILQLLEQELKVEVVEVRQLAINAITKILLAAATQSQKQSPYLSSLRAAWMSRRNDKHFKCRLAWIRGAVELICAGSDEGSNALLEGIQDRIEDSDERVRLALLNEFLTSIESFSTIIKLPSFAQFIQSVADRCFDKREEVQSAAWLLTSDFLFAILRTTPQSPHLVTLINYLLQLPFSESRIFIRAAMGFLEEGVFMRLAREYPRIEDRCEKLIVLLHSVYANPVKNAKSLHSLQALFRRKSQFSKAWLGLLKIARIQQTKEANDMINAKAVQLAQFLAELVPGVGELEAQRSLISLQMLPSETIQLLIELSESRIGLSKVEAHFKASTAIDPQLKKIVLACIPFGSQISINTALIGALSAASSDSTAAALLQDILAEFPHLFANRTAELVSAALKDPSAAHLKALAQYVSKDQSRKLAADAQAKDLERLLLEMVHPPIGAACACLRAIASAAQILLQLTNVSELIENLILQLANVDDFDQVSVALAALTGIAKGGQARALMPQFESLFSLISHRCFPSESVFSGASGAKKAKTANNATSDLLQNWPKIADLSDPLKIATLSVRFLAVFASSLIRQYTRTHVQDDSSDDLELVSSLRSITLGFFLDRLEALNAGKSKQHPVRLKYSLLKGLITCLPDASVADLTGPLMPLFLAMQDADHALRLKLVTLLGRLLIAHRLSPAFLSLLFVGGAHEPLTQVRSTVKSLIGDVSRSAHGLVERELLGVLCVVVVKHPDCQEVRLNREFIKGYFDFFNECSLNQNNCADIYESISALKLLHFPGDTEASTRLYQVSELAQLSIKDRCAQHHWPLSSTSHAQKQTLSMLLPEVLMQLEEGEQGRNIHRVYLAEERENLADDNNGVGTKKLTSANAVNRTRVKLSKQQK